MSRHLLVIGNRNYSSWSMRGWLMCRKSGIEFEELRIPLNSSFVAEIKSYNPAGLVPVLLVDDFAIWDSLAMAEYLAETNPSLWPQDRNQRARARSIVAEMHSGYSNLRNELPMNCRARGRSVAFSPFLLAELERLEASLIDCLESSGGPFLFGTFCIADVFFAPVISRLLTYGYQSDNAAFNAYSAAMLADPDIAEWFELSAEEPETLAHVEFGDSAPLMAEPKNLSQFPIHLGRAGDAVSQPQFSGDMSWYMEYGMRHASDALDGSLLTNHNFSSNWAVWEMHPHGHEVVICTEGSFELLQLGEGNHEHRIVLQAGDYAINSPGIWHTANASSPCKAIFITAGVGTQHRPRD